MSNMSEGNRMDVVSQIFAGNNGTSIVGIMAIMFIVVTDRLCNSQYKISRREGNSELVFEPAVRVWNEELSSQTIKEDAVKMTTFDK